MKTLKESILSRSSHTGEGFKAQRRDMIETWLNDINYTGITSSISVPDRDGEKEEVAIYNASGQKTADGHDMTGICITRYKKAGKIYSQKSINIYK